MCFNCVIINPTRMNIKFLIDEILEEARTNDDGYSAFADGEVCRALKLKEMKKFLKKHKTARLLSVHFRKASLGAISLENVHMWKVGRYYVSHNGFAEEGGKARVLSDTREMIENPKFREMVENERWDDAEKVLNERNFYGVLMMVREDGKKAVFVMNKPMHITTNGKVIVFSNTRMDLEVRLFGILLDAPYQVVDDSVIVYDVERLAVEKMRKVKIVRRYTITSYVGDYIEVSPGLWVRKSDIPKSELPAEKKETVSDKSEFCQGCLYGEYDYCFARDAALKEGKCSERVPVEVSMKEREADAEAERDMMCYGCRYEDEDCDYRRRFYAEYGECERREFYELLEEERDELAAYRKIRRWEE